MWAIYCEGTPTIKGDNLIDLTKLCNDLNSNIKGYEYYIGEDTNG